MQLSAALFLPRYSQGLARVLSARGIPVRHSVIQSPHGHDAILIEWEQLEVQLRGALGLGAGHGRVRARSAGVVRATV